MPRRGGAPAKETRTEPEDQLEGRNPVNEALRAGRPVERLLVESDPERRGPLADIVSMARRRGVRVDEVTKQVLDRMSVTGMHQGVVAKVAAKPYVDLQDLLNIARSRGEQPLLLLCDGLQDPHNLGALLRTADAVGAHGVVIPVRRSVGLTATVARTSAGALEHVAVSKVTNLAQTIALLQQAGIWVVGAEATSGSKLPWEIDLSGPLALVVGAEGEGLGRLVTQRCDTLVRLPMHGRVNSLNASVAASVLLYEVVRQRTQLGSVR